MGGVSFVIIEHEQHDGGYAAMRAQRDRVGTWVHPLLGPDSAGAMLQRSPGRRPWIEAPEPVGCSIAHAGRFSMLGIMRGREIGIDLEMVRPELPLSDVAATFFTTTEVRWLRDLPASQQPLATTLLWSAKEALLKAIGAGVMGGLSTPLLDDVDPGPILRGARELSAELAGGAVLSLCQGLLGSGRSVMAIVSLDRRPTSMGS